jgi:chaperonin cofactor prefoldin
MPRSFSLLVLVVLFATFAAAQSPTPSSPAPASPSQNPVPPDETKKPKKVWTNDNLSDANGAVSVVGDTKNGPKKKLNAAKPADEQYIASLRKQLNKLQEQIADADKQIADLTSFSKGEPSSSASGIKLNKGYNREPIEVQIRALQEKKKDLQAKTDALLDEARKKGVEPGQLR